MSILAGLVLASAEEVRLDEAMALLLNILCCLSGPFSALGRAVANAVLILHPGGFRWV